MILPIQCSVFEDKIRGTQPAKPEKPERPAQPAVSATPTADVPAGYADMTVADIKVAASGWDADALSAALVYENEHGRRKGAIAALESAMTHKEDES